MRILTFFAATVFFCFSFGVSNAADIGAVWTGSGTADLDGIAIEVTRDGGDDFSTFTYDASVPNFSFAPLSTTETSLDYSHNSNLSISFSSPVERLRLYLVYWRTGTYQLNRPFEIKSGSNFTQSGNEITVSGGFASGVIEFTEPVSSLEILSSAYNSGSYSRQILQFGTGTPDAHVPEAPTITIKGSGMIRTTRRVVTIRGTAEGSEGIKSVEVRAEGGSYAVAKGTSSWSFRFKPKRKMTRVTARATDKAGSTSSEASAQILMNRPTAAAPNRSLSPRDVSL
jgi:hypothetical protein